MCTCCMIKNTRMLDNIQSNFALSLFFLVDSEPQSSAQPKISHIDLCQGAYSEHQQRGVFRIAHLFTVHWHFVLTLRLIQQHQAGSERSHWVVCSGTHSAAKWKCVIKSQKSIQFNVVFREKKMFCIVSVLQIVSFILSHCVSSS